MPASVLSVSRRNLTFESRVAAQTFFEAVGTTCICCTPSFCPADELVMAQEEVRNPPYSCSPTAVIHPAPAVPQLRSNVRRRHPGRKLFHGRPLRFRRSFTAFELKR